MRIAHASPASAAGQRARAARYWPTILVAAVCVVIAYENGGYGLTARTILAVCVLWATIIGLAFGFIPRAEVTRGALVVGGLLAGLAAWTLASTAWAPSAGAAFEEFNRVSLYLAVFALAAVAASRRDIGRWADGLCIGVVATAVIALSSRLFPSLFPSSRDLGVFLPYAVTRLSFPVGYWNGLAVLVGLGLPLCLRAAIVGDRRSTRALAIAATPVLASVVYLASSRGGAATALVGVAVFFACTDRRWAALGALLPLAAGSTLAIAVLAQRRTLVNGPLASATAVSQGRIAAVLICGCCLLAGGLLLMGERALRDRFRPRPAVGWMLVGATAAIVIVGISLSHPVARFESFKRPLSAGRVAPSDFATAHLLSGNGSGRWQFWTAALDEFRSSPFHGRGAGSYQFWWAQHASFTYFLKNAHSLYLEVLAELGLVGFMLVAGVMLGGLGVAALRVRAASGDERVTLAALTAVFAAFAAAAAIDWVWQLPAVAVIAFIALGLVTGGAAPAESRATDRRIARQGSHRAAVGISVLVIAWALICAQAIPWLAATKISDSQAAVRRGDLSAATKNALDAKSLQPWSSSPYLQLALVAEQRGDLAGAQAWIAKAIARDRTDWAVWLIASRIQRKSGLTAEAARSYERARSLNPRSALFQGRD
jgi:O-Antigen ligase